MQPGMIGGLRVRLAETDQDRSAALRLRHLCFIAGRIAGAAPEGEETDEFDALCDHMLVEDPATGALVACFRMLALADGAQIERSYSARRYDLSALRDFDGPMVEMGRFCIHPERRDPRVLRTAWAAMSLYVEAKGAKLLFGCSSFEGTDIEEYRDSFALLRARHLAPRRWLPRVRAPEVFRFGRLLRRHQPDEKRGLRMLPPLLRGYLSMGGWVSDHAVIDRDLRTMHVFTGVEVASIPARLRRILTAG